MPTAEYADLFDIDSDANGDPILVDPVSGDTMATWNRSEGAWVPSQLGAAANPVPGTSHFENTEHESVSTDQLNNVQQAESVSEVVSLFTDGGAGTVVKLEPGEYTTNQKLTFQSDDQILIATGASVTWDAGYDDTAIVPGGFADTKIIGGTWDHNGANQTGGNGLSTAGEGQRFVRMDIRNAAETAFRAGGGNDIKFINCRSINAGASLSTQPAGTGDGFYLEDATSSEVVSPYVESPWRGGVVFERDGGGTEPEASALQGGTFVDCPIGVDHAAPGAAVEINGPTFRNCGTTGRNYSTDEVSDIQIESSGANVDGWTSFNTARRSVRITDGGVGADVRNGVVWGANQDAADNQATGVIQRDGSTSRHGLTIENVRINQANEITGVLITAPDTGVKVSGIKSGNLYQGVRAESGVSGVVSDCRFDGAATSYSLRTGHEIKLRDNESAGATNDYVTQDMAVADGNDPGVTGDVRTINNAQTNARAYHDGSGANTEGPAYYDGSGWVSLVDGSAIA